MAVPDRQLVDPADGEDDACDLVSQLELLPDEGQDEVLPDLVGVAFRELQAERGALSMLIDLPDGLDPPLENVDRRAFRHLIRPLQMLVHAPELVYCAEIGERLDVLLVPPIGLVLCINCVRVVQSAE